MTTALLFILGAAFGSFVNVLALRYREDRVLLDPRAWSGRSHCPHCRRTLRAFELVPLLSFFVQSGRCRTCRSRLSFVYPASELLSGLIFALVPFRLPILFPGLGIAALAWGSLLWITAFTSLLLMSLIDFRLQIIPDELQLWLGFLGCLLVAWAFINLGDSGSLLGPYMLLFGLSGNILLNRILSIFLAAGFIGLLILGTRGRGMGVGDLKLAAVLGLIFGWPEAVLLLLVAFVLGGLYGVLAMSLGQKRLRSAVAFGPFLALAAFLIFLWGQEMLSAYFGLMQLQWAAAG